MGIDWKASKIDGRVHAYDPDHADKGPLCMSAKKVAGDDSKKSPCPTCLVSADIFGSRPLLSGQAHAPKPYPGMRSALPPEPEGEAAIAEKPDREKRYFVIRLDSGCTMEFWGEMTRESEVMGGDAYAVFVGPGENGAIRKVRKRSIQSIVVLHEDEANALLHKTKGHGLLGAAKRFLRKIGLGGSK